MTTARTARGEFATREPLVLIIDDEDQTAFADAVNNQGVDALAMEPDDLDVSLLRRASVVVVDQYLDHWPGRDTSELPVTLTVPDGLALSAVLRSHIEASAPSVAFVLRTGEMERLGQGLPTGAREHLLASQYNLEWVFSKAGSPDEALPTPAARIASLAIASASLPADWDAGSHDPGLRWLALADTVWAADARWQVEQCRPPQHVVAQRTRGGAWLRWFLQKALPYPTFLMDEVRAALALGVTVAALGQVMASDSELKRRLDEVAYAGPLNEFLGRRWWRAGMSRFVNELEVELGDGAGVDIADLVSRFHGEDLEPVLVPSPVIGINADYSTRLNPLNAAESVRLQPDGWPPYADDPWAPRAELSGPDADEELRALVVSTDRWSVRDGSPSSSSQGNISSLDQGNRT